MKILVGLGNPGQQYEHTRHNIGFRFIETIAQHEKLIFSVNPRFRSEIAIGQIGDEKVLLVKPQTFMNNTGEAVAVLLRYYNLSTTDMFVVFDDLDLPAGKIRLKKGGGHGGHNGLRSLHQHLDNTNYYRIKIGIGRPPHGNITGWVLGQADESDRADEACAFSALKTHLTTILQGNIADAANAIHLQRNT